jgi:hypothetical protein
MGRKFGSFEEKVWGDHLCIDFRNLYRASEKDNYLVPSMEQLFHTVSSSDIF